MARRLTRQQVDQGINQSGSDQEDLGGVATLERETANPSAPMGVSTRNKLARLIQTAQSQGILALASNGTVLVAGSTVGAGPTPSTQRQNAGTNQNQTGQAKQRLSNQRFEQFIQQVTGANQQSTGSNGRTPGPATVARAGIRAVVAAQVDREASRLYGLIVASEDVSAFTPQDWDARAQQSIQGAISYLTAINAATGSVSRSVVAESQG